LERAFLPGEVSREKAMLDGEPGCFGEKVLDAETGRLAEVTHGRLGKACQVVVVDTLTAVLNARSGISGVV